MSVGREPRAVYQFSLLLSAAAAVDTLFPSSLEVVEADSAEELVGLSAAAAAAAAASRLDSAVVVGRAGR